MNHAVEIVGKVQSDLSIKVLASTDFGTRECPPGSYDITLLLDDLLCETIEAAPKGTASLQ